MQEKIEQKLEESFKRAEEYYGKTFPRPGYILWKRNGTMGGYSWKFKNHMMFQLDFAEANEEDYLNQIVPHEAAHWIQDCIYGCGKTKPHGREWKNIMLYCFRLQPDRCHSYDSSVTKTKAAVETPYIYCCGCIGKEFKLSETKHFRMRNGYKGRPYRRICTTCRHDLSYVRKEFVDPKAKQKAKLLAQLAELEKLEQHVSD